MILKGNQRAGGIQLARHLMNVTDNEHVSVHEMRGFIADDLHGAFNEAYAISRGTKCQQFLFSLSLNPPENEIVPIEVFEKAITDIEQKMGLIDQPRALVFHEKEGRRYAHCVWSRIDADQMKAINLPHYKLKLKDISRELYLEHGWKMPRGLMNSADRVPVNSTRSSGALALVGCPGLWADWLGCVIQSIAFPTSLSQANLENVLRDILTNRLGSGPVN